MEEAMVRLWPQSPGPHVLQWQDWNQAERRCAISGHRRGLCGPSALCQESEPTCNVLCQDVRAYLPPNGTDSRSHAYMGRCHLYRCRRLPWIPQRGRHCTCKPFQAQVQGLNSLHHLNGLGSAKAPKVLQCSKQRRCLAQLSSMTTAANEVPGSFFLEGKCDSYPFCTLHDMLVQLQGRPINFDKEQTNRQGAAWWPSSAGEEKKQWWLLCSSSRAN